MNKTALITGASKGIGLEMARLHASSKGNLVLTARSEKELLEIKSELEAQFPINVYVIAKDLSSPDAPKALFDEIKRQHIEVDYLINNAGFGDYGYFSDTEWVRYRQMIDLNVSALTELCYLFGKDWKGRKPGKILNVASTAAFQPGPKMAVYFATKAYVLSFSEAVGQELNKQGISVTALCPGPTATYFMEDSRMKASGMVKRQKLPTPVQVAEYGYKAMLKGKAVAVHGTMNRVIANANRFLPRKWVVKLTAKLL
ncbi:MAG: SDR family oxidoreductase [Dysgonamonadaceae bacterium]|jgi:short-subunit dehydrogenase|nr:SDR family oxidoreductase [Dysgonamonadaceae bacterium]